jgi:hypothetical protein
MIRKKEAAVDAGELDTVQPTLFTYAMTSRFEEVLRTHAIRATSGKIVLTSREVSIEGLRRLMALDFLRGMR